jgi:hypothetical protein
MTKVLKSYEDQTVKIAELEKKLKNQKLKHERELKSHEDNFVEKLKAVKKTDVETIYSNKSVLEPEIKSYRKISSVERNSDEVKAKVEKFKSVIEKKLTNDSNRVNFYNIEYCK